MRIAEAIKRGLGADDLINFAQPGKPLLEDAPVCGGNDGCGKMRRRIHESVEHENDLTQLTFYVCETKGCPHQNIPRQIRERREL